MVRNVLESDALEIKNLATRENGREHLVLFRGRQDENGMRGRLLQRLQKSVEGRLGEHVHLVDDVDLEATHLGGEAHLINQLADVVYRIVRGRVQLKNIKAVILIGPGVYLVDPAG